MKLTVNQVNQLITKANEGLEKAMQDKAIAEKVNKLVIPSTVLNLDKLQDEKDITPFERPVELVFTRNKHNHFILTEISIT